MNTCKYCNSERKIEMDNNGPIVDCPVCELEVLEPQIAYSAARSDIECYSIARYEGGVPQVDNRWWDVRPCPESNDPELQQTIIDPAVRYLQLRGLITRHPIYSGWVRILDQKNE